MKQVFYSLSLALPGKPIPALIHSAALLCAAALMLLPIQTVQAGPEGQLDLTFSHDGKTTANLGEGQDGMAVIVQKDGKIVVVGDMLPAVGPRDFAVARFNADGTPDSGFGGDGTVTTNIGSNLDLGQTTSYDSSTAAAIQKDGKIVVAGFTNAGKKNFFDFDFAVVRYLPNGDLDSTFGKNGIVTTTFTSDSEDRAFAVAVQSDGKIVVAGSSPNAPGFNDFALARYLPDGTPDKSFSGDGRVITDFTGGFDFAKSMVIQKNGKIVLAGPTTATHLSVDFGLARYNTDGSLDNSFGGDGRAVTDFFGLEDELSAIALQADGKIVAVGTTTDGFVFDFSLARYLPNGSLDKGFSGDGRIISDFGSNTERAFDVTVQPDGKIIAAGESFQRTNDFALAHYLSNGTLDQSFGTHGKVFTDFKDAHFGTSQSDSARAITLQKDGKIVAAGATFGASDPVFAVARYRTFVCNGQDVTLLGSNNNDTLNGTQKRDVISGLGGNDILRGFGGDDLLCGNEGDDKLDGGSGNDNCNGGLGTDTAVSCELKSNIP